MSDSNNNNNNNTNNNPLPSTPSSSSSSNKLSLFDSTSFANSSHAFDDSYELFDDNQPIWSDHMDQYVPQQSQFQSQSQPQSQTSFDWASVTSPNFLYEDSLSPTEKLKALAFKKPGSFSSDLHTIQPKDIILKDHPMHDCYPYMESYECPPPHHPCVIDSRSKVELYRQEELDSDDDEEDDEALFEEPYHNYCEDAVMDIDDDEISAVTTKSNNNNNSNINSMSPVFSPSIPTPQHQHPPALSSSSSLFFSPSFASSSSPSPAPVNVVSPSPPATTNNFNEQLEHSPPAHQHSLIIQPPANSSPFKHAKKRSISQSTTHRCEHVNPVTGKPCNKVFSRPYDLIRHQDTIHARVRKTFKCQMCGDNSKTFSRMDALSRHIRVKHSK